MDGIFLGFFPGKKLMGIHHQDRANTSTRGWGKELHWEQPVNIPAQILIESKALIVGISQSLMRGWMCSLPGDEVASDLWGLSQPHKLQT